MTYEEAVSKINSLLRFGMQPGLERIEELLRRMGNPQKKLRFVHVAGTNGKGSTCALLSSVLTKAGYKTGRFTSPFVTEFRERMQIDDEMISEEDLARILNEVYPLVEQMAGEGLVITEFELITALAFAWFYEKRCDVVVLEVGLGGRFDATNVIDCPLLSVICSISLDHTAILGDTVEQIAFEKCGILKRGGAAVVYPVQPGRAMDVIREQAREKRCALRVTKLDLVKVLEKGLRGSKLSHRGMTLFLPFIGEHQVKNAETVLTAIDLLRQRGLQISDEAVKEGVAAAKLPARLELLSEQPVVLLDGAHNPGGAEALGDAIKAYLPGKRVVGVMGMLSDKDSGAALHTLGPLFSSIITLEPDSPRALKSEDLAKRAREYCADVIPLHDYQEAFSQALLKAGEDGAVVICGSLYLAGAIRPVILDAFQAEK